MSKKLTIKQEKFCQEYVVNGGNASEAYRKAYRAKDMKDETVWVAACNVLKNHKVAIRVKELTEASHKKLQVSKEKLTKMLFETIEDGKLPLTKKSKRMRDPQLVRGSVMDLAKLHGFLRNTDDPIAANYVRMDKVFIDGKPKGWGVGKPPGKKE